MPYLTAAIPQYRTDVISITQYFYSDSEVAEIKCPFPLGRLSSLYEFSWDRVVGIVGSPITNGTRGVYWLAEENNRILHVNISAAPDSRYQCIGAVQTCSGTPTCRVIGRDSPIITIIDTTGKHKFVNLKFMMVVPFVINVPLSWWSSCIFHWYYWWFCRSSHHH